MTQGTLNNLAKESSPYLLEHAANPVNWFAWNDEAFKLAKEQHKMIFVSVGYSACHWCHVMRHESFENEEVASILNDHFISIKVDREERPDIDHTLQLTFQIMNRRGGGWPLSIFMTPDQKPFYSGTYFPFKSTYGMPGFIDVLKAVINAYETKLEQIQSQSSQIENYLIKIAKPDLDEDLTSVASLDIISSLSQFYEPSYGGFGQAPKFPSETTIALLLHESAFSSQQAGLKMVFKTLDHMIEGGIYDQLGGGFHRYSVDDKWLVPHFEKMLYNQSLLTSVLLEAFRLTKNPRYQEVVTETLHYVIREMMTSEGGFYSSQNADSENVEGKFFVWNNKDLDFLDQDQKNIISDHLDITKKGNWEGKNILHVTKTSKDLSTKYSKTESEIQEIITRTKQLMFEEREKRVKPSTDTKIITSWNALMLKSFIKAYRIVTDPQDKELFFNTAVKSINFILDMIEDTIIYRIYNNNKKSIKGFLDDFEYTISALLDFYEVTLTEKYLDTARLLFKYSLDYFYDNDLGGFFFSLADHKTIVTRYKEYLDSPLPSANAYAVENALRLAFFYDQEANFYQIIAEKTLRQLKIASEQDFMSLSSMIYVKQLFLNHFTEITVSYASQDNQLHKIVNHIWLPYRLQIDFNISRSDENLDEKNFLKGKKDSKNAVYVCSNHVCSLPLTNEDQILQYLINLYPSGMFKINT